MEQKRQSQHFPQQGILIPKMGFEIAQKGHFT
jgi:hypothetical protein